MTALQIAGVVGVAGGVLGTVLILVGWVLYKITDDEDTAGLGVLGLVALLVGAVGGSVAFALWAIQ